MFERALAKRPEDRFATALELAGALRSAAGLGASRAELPKVDEGVRDAWLEEAPQPLAESVAALDGARNAHQARDAAQELVRTLLRYLLALALATWSAGDAQDDPALLELVRALSKRALAAEERLQLLRLLVRPHGDHPVPELVDLVRPGPDGTDALEPILGFYSLTDHAGSEDAVRLRLTWLIPELTQLLRKTTFVLDYLLVVPRDHAAERWTGQRQQHRGHAVVVEGKLVDGHPMLLDRNGRICADLWPLVQTAAPSDGAEPELFVFDGRGRHGAQLIAAPRSIVRDDSNAWKWVATRLIAEVEAQARMHDQVRTAARQWQDQARPDGLLWRGNVLADFELWTRHTSAAPLGDLEEEFIAACRRVARRARRIRRSLVAAGMLTVLAGVVTALGVVADRAEQRTHMAEQLVIQAKVEQGRAALLHDETAQARRSLGEAYRLGDHSPEVTYMLARALQPLMAEQARFEAAKGRMWSTAWSPDGLRIVTTDDTCAQIWDARTSRLLFTLPHGDTVYQAAYSVDGTRLITTSGDGVVRIWDVTNGALVRELKHDGKPRRYLWVATSPDGTLVAAIDTMGEVTHVWDAGTGAPLAELRNNASGFASLAFSSDGRWLATSGGDDARVFDSRTWKLARLLATKRVRSLSFDPTGPRLLTGTAGGDASIWAILSGERVHHLRETGKAVDRVAFSPDGQLVVVASHDGAEQVWDAGSGALLSEGNFLRSKISSIEFDPTSKLVLAAGTRGMVVVSDVAQGMPVAVLEGPQGVVWSAHFDPNSQRVVGASLDGTAWVWDATPPYRQWSSPPISDDCGLVTSLEPDRRFIAVGCRDQATRVWDAAHDQLLAELPSVTQVEGDFDSAFAAVSADGDRAAIARGNTVVVYELPGGRPLRTIAHGAAVNAVAFASAGRDLVSGAVDGSLFVTRDGHEPIALPPSAAGIDTAGFLPDGRVVAADARRHLRVFDPSRGAVAADLEIPARAGLVRASPDALRMITVPRYADKAPPVLWDLERYRLIAELKGHIGQVRSARWVRGGHELLTAGIDGSARTWDGGTGLLLQTYRGSTRFLADATISPDGSIVAGDADGLLWFWDAASGRQLWTLQAHTAHVVGIHFEGSEIVTRGFAGELSRWRLPNPERVIETCSSGAACGIVAK